MPGNFYTINANFLTIEVTILNLQTAGYPPIDPPDSYTFPQFPDMSPIEHIDSPRCQRSQISAFCAGLYFIRGLCAIFYTPSFVLKIKCCVDKVLRRSIEPTAEMRSSGCAPEHPLRRIRPVVREKFLELRNSPRALATISPERTLGTMRWAADNPKWTLRWLRLLVICGYQILGKVS